MRAGIAMAWLFASASAAAQPALDAAFERAVLFGEPAAVAAWLDRDPEQARARDRFGFTALHNVMCEEKFDTMALLVRRGADVDARNDVGMTPLHLACWPQAVDLLVSLGAQVDVRADNGDTPLLTVAGEPDRDDVVAALLRHGADPRARDRAGDTALAIAIRRGDTAMQRVLRRAGATP